MDKKLIFGFGSLIEESSLRATAPNATNIRPAYIKGFRRDFSLWDPVGYDETNLDLAGIPFTALDVQPIGDSEARVNGVVFEVQGDELVKMLRREKEYKRVETVAYDYKTDESVGVCEVFSAGKNNAEFDFNSVPQLRYLENYLRAVKRFGEKYYQEILNTTYIGKKALSEFPQLLL